MRSFGPGALAAVTLSGCLEQAVIARVRDGGAAVDAMNTTDVRPMDTGAPPPDAASRHFVLRATFAASGTLNARAPEGFTARFAVTVTRDGAPFDSATVRVQSSTGELVLDPMGGGVFAGEQRGWQSRYAVTLQQGATEIWSRSFATLAAHRFTSPSPMEHIERDEPFVLAWTPSGASAATLSAPGVPSRSIMDVGRVTLMPSSLFPGAPTELVTLSLLRADSVAIDGLDPGSSLRFEVTNSIDLRYENR